MIDTVLGTNGTVYVVEGLTGNEYKENLKKLNKQLKAQGKIVIGTVVVKALIFTEDIK